jgi:hypothetical protein
VRETQHDVELAESYEDNDEDFGGYCPTCAVHYTAREAQQHAGH